MAKHVCPQHYAGDDAQGDCYFEIEASDRVGFARLEVAWSCVVVHRGEIPLSWLSEVIAIATGHKGGIAGFLEEHHYGDALEEE